MTFNLQVDTNKNKTEIFISGNQTSLIKCGHTDEGFRAVDPGVMERGRGGRPEARVNVITRPRPRSVAVPNPATSGIYISDFTK